MYVATTPGGLGISPAALAIIGIAASTGGSILAARLSRPRTPSQRDLEEQLRLQTELEIQRMQAAQQVQSQHTSELGRYLVPAAAVLALVMLLR